jgi:hypothetical protein
MPPPGACEHDHLVISQIRTRGVAGATDEFVELHNPTAAAVTLDATWRLQSRSTTSTSFSTRWKGGASVTVRAGGRVLLVGKGFAAPPGAALPLVSGITDAAALRLVQGATVVDEVCFAFDDATRAAFDASFGCGGAPASNLPHANRSDAAGNVDASLLRRGDGAGDACVDSGDDGADFTHASPAVPHAD